MKQRQLKASVAKLGGKLVRDFCDEVTHVVTLLENGLVRRTMKYAHAVLSGKWIVGFDCTPIDSQFSRIN